MWKKTWKEVFDGVKRVCRRGVWERKSVCEKCGEREWRGDMSHLVEKLRGFREFCITQERSQKLEEVNQKLVEQHPALSRRRRRGGGGT